MSWTRVGVVVAVLLALCLYLWLQKRASGR
jgi:hypothetical protein